MVLDKRIDVQLYYVSVNLVVSSARKTTACTFPESNGPAAQGWFPDIMAIYFKHSNLIPKMLIILGASYDQECTLFCVQEHGPWAPELVSAPEVPGSNPVAFSCPTSIFLL
ncbi:hypothetical protein DSO57_1022420 [Entomophthora muscae]|uniref:Uncharacterized protein n=1 Tax=Entomophthora muscae TaxID=34485 RepID=A0ACC2S529_9FUNG|nr:hypothetical protein DSO57_1022420 [Entomophthora muscae]